jgi:tRNA (mo5U34)-methyltransferase
VQELLERSRAIRWYHTIELAPGHVTDGWFDLRPVVDRYGLPERMDGMRALDVGTWDGFWAFEMERRGAEVVALDVTDPGALDWPPRRRFEAATERPRGEGFRLAREALGSSVEGVELSVYDLRPDELGTFDVVFCGSVVMHLRDQLLALERIASVCRGTFVSAEEYDPLVGLLPFPAARYLADRTPAVVFWLPSARLWRRMLWTAGFDHVERVGKFKLPSTEGWSVRHVVHHARRAPA